MQRLSVTFASECLDTILLNFKSNAGNYGSAKPITIGSASLAMLLGICHSPTNPPQFHQLYLKIYSQIKDLIFCSRNNFISTDRPAIIYQNFLTLVLSNNFQVRNASLEIITLTICKPHGKEESFLQIFELQYLDNLAASKVILNYLLYVLSLTGSQAKKMPYAANNSEKISALVKINLFLAHFCRFALHPSETFKDEQVDIAETSWQV